MTEKTLDLILEKLDRMHDDIKEIREHQDDLDKQFVINVLADWAAEALPIRKLLGQA
jgi:hypothetical protein